MIARPYRRLAAVLLVLLAATQTAACSSEQLAAGFRSWCRSSDRCDDHTRPQPP